jgi:cytochrome P450
MSQFGGFVQELLIDPRRAAGPTEDPDDVVDLLVGAEIDGRRLTDQEIRQMVMAVLAAGFETSYKAFTSFLWTLAEDAEAWKTIRSGAVSFASAFEELLRLASPVSVGRTATRDVTVGGQRIKAGDSVVMCLPAVNRDGAEFDDPESLLLSRQPNRHLTFGTGIHRCIGMHVARLELSVALQEVLTSFERIWIPADAAPVFSGSQAAGITALPLAFTRVPTA